MTEITLPDSTLKITFRVLLILVAVLLFAGCLDLDTTIRFNPDLSGTVELRYVIDSDLYDLGVYDPDVTFLPVPVGENDFRRLERSNPGLRLRSHRTNRDGGVVTVEVRIEFDSPRGLERILGGSSRITVLPEQDQYRFRMELAGSPGQETDHTEDDLASLLLGEYHLGFSVLPSGTVRSVSAGEITETGRAARWRISMAEVAVRPESTIWEVTWDR